MKYMDVKDLFKKIEDYENKDVGFVIIEINLILDLLILMMEHIFKIYNLYMIKNYLILI